MDAKIDTKIQFGQFFKWTHSSYYFLSGFLSVVFLIVIVWWPLAEEYLAFYDPQYPFWIQIDWLLLGIFFFMSMMIMAGANLKRDWITLVVGLAGGLVIEAWGTQTFLWTYYTNERPPLWILPAWPIASLTIDRMEVLLAYFTSRIRDTVFIISYWAFFIAFYGLMIVFTIPTINKSFTILALFICFLLLVTVQNKRRAVLIFIAGSALGYFLEIWGTTRECWTYYTQEKPPVFAIFAHGLAATAFWWSRSMLVSIIDKIRMLAKQVHNKGERLGQS
jgi:hypothetical protein